MYKMIGRGLRNIRDTYRNGVKATNLIHELGKRNVNMYRESELEELPDDLISQLEEVVDRFENFGKFRQSMSVCMGATRHPIKSFKNIIYITALDIHKIIYGDD